MDTDAEELALAQRIGARIRGRRVRLGLTQEQLARKLGISYQQIQKYENGSNRIAAARLMLLARSLGVPAADFLVDPAEGRATASPAPLAPIDEATLRELALDLATLADTELAARLRALTRAVVERRSRV